MSAVAHNDVDGTLNMDDEAVASLLQDVKMIAAKEVKRIDEGGKQDPTERTPQTRQNFSSYTILRGRSISFATEEVADDLSAHACASLSPLLSPESIANPMKQPKVVLPDLIEHHDWSDRVGSYDQDLQVIVRKKSNKKDDSFVGEIPKTKVRATLRRKFSWKKYPELEQYLLTKRRTYFEFSSRNYTPEQRNFNNTLTREMLELASRLGYAFEGFTFSMIRDRIRCYFKSYVQTAKKRGIKNGTRVVKNSLSPKDLGRSTNLR